jgi:serine/threonine-protein phosphatase 5
MARGNHESRNLNKLYGFEGEVKNKYDESVYECFCELFCFLPLGHVLNKKVLVVHGGLFSQDGVTLDQIKKENRFREPPEKGIMCEILWADPGKLPGRQPSKRGVGLTFGPDIAKKFLDSNGLDILVRSHEVKDQGYEEEADGRVITIFSAPNYCDQMGNKGALIRFKGDEMKPKYVQFTAVVILFLIKGSP